MFLLLSSLAVVAGSSQTRTALEAIVGEVAATCGGALWVLLRGSEGLG